MSNGCLSNHNLAVYNIGLGRGSGELRSSRPHKTHVSTNHNAEFQNTW